MQRHADFALLEHRFGINMPLAMDYLPAALAYNVQLALDAQPGLISVSNSGVPAYLTNYLDPKLITVLTSPMKIAQIVGETKKGDWTTKTALFPIIESAGEVSSYGDYANNGEVTANVNWPQRQSYGYQTVTEWGDKELADMGTGQINWAAGLTTSSALIMTKFQNKSYAFGIAGLQNYGLLNDPALSTPLTPSTKTGGGVTWSAASLGTEVYADIQALVQQLIVQSGGTVEMTDPLNLCLSPAKAAIGLTKVTSFNVNVMDMIKKNYPAMTIETAVEYTTGSGDLVQLIAPSIDGQDTASAAFTEKMRAHGVVRALSSFAEKKSGGTWGCIIYRPLGISQMLGI
jgi:hypothetical protein